MSRVPIIHIPHPTLRKKAAEITEFSPEIELLASQLTETLQSARKPRGVGLAAPQINVEKRMFATLIDQQARIFINPVITNHSKTLTLGKDAQDPDLEGCLSIPKLYAPVPRFSWIELSFAELKDDKLVTKTERFEDFAARVIQHERDHLDGILFLDYALEYDLPVMENADKLRPVPRSVVETLVHNTWKQATADA